MKWKLCLLVVVSNLMIPSAPQAREIQSPSVKSRSPRFHSHNDYLHEHPLEDAIQAGVSSVEADVWKFWDGLYVSHFPIFGKSGSLDSWYLDPWSRSTELQTSQKWDYLWMDIKGPASGVEDALLSRLTSLFHGQSAKRPIIVLTGDGGAKRELASQLSGSDAGNARVLRDADRVLPSDPPRKGEADPWGWYSLSWPDRYTWDGSGCMPAAEWKSFVDEVALVRTKHRQVRYFHVPNTVSWVRLAEKAGVDLIDVDDLSLPGRAMKAATDPDPRVCP